MTTTYSLLVWGGRLGNTVTFTYATNVCNFTNHGLYDGTPLQFTGADIPEGLSLSTTYYTHSTSDNTFTLHPTAQDGIDGTNTIDISDNGTGEIKAVSEFWVNFNTYGANYGNVSKTRYGNVDNERVYSSLEAWHSARVAALPGIYDVEILEIGHRFVSRSSSNIYYTNGFNCDEVLITSKINGIHTNAFHYRRPGTGFNYIHSAGGGFSMYGVNAKIDSIQITYTGSGIAVQTSLASVVSNCIIQGTSAAIGGINVYNAGPKIFNNIVYGFSNGKGIYAQDYSPALGEIYNNLSTKNLYGLIAGFNSSTAWWKNNVSVGNTINWGQWPYNMALGSAFVCNNVGELSDKKVVTFNLVDSTVVLNAHGLNNGNRLRFQTTGQLPSPLTTTTSYFVSSVTTNTFKVKATQYGAEVVISGVPNAGSGTHYLPYVWGTLDAPDSRIYIDFSIPDNVFRSWSSEPYDFRPAHAVGDEYTPHAAALQVDAGATISNGYAFDMEGNRRPAYVNGNDSWDCGPLEFDYGNVVPLEVSFVINGLVAGAEVRAYKVSDNAEIDGGSESIAGTTHTFTYNYTEDIPIYIVVIALGYKIKYITGISLISTDQSLFLEMQIDRQYENPT